MENPERIKSTHKSEVVSVKLEPHPSADTLSIVKIWGYQCCVKTKDWLNVDKGVYIVPDSVVDVRRPEFSFLAEQAKADGTARIKAKRLRTIVSYGLLIPAPKDAVIGDDLAEFLGVTRYEPPEPSESQQDKFVISGESEPGPEINTGPNVYDVDAFERFTHLLVENEIIVAMEKVDGSNFRAVYHNDRYWVKTRKRWVKRIPDYSHVNLECLTNKGLPKDKAIEIIDKIKNKPVQINDFWKILEKTEPLMKFLRDNPNVTVYGEIFGSTNRIKYQFPEGNRFAAFDIFDNKFLNIKEFIEILNNANVPIVPIVFEGQYNFNKIKEISEGTTLCENAKPKTIREGVVIRPIKERWEREIGRVQLKCTNPNFLTL